MKKLMALVPVLGFAILSAGDALAVGATSSGNECVPLLGSFQYATVGIASGADGYVTSCPIQTDDQALGTTVNFRMRVYDNSTTAGYSCTGYVYDQNGNSIAVTALTKTTTAAFQGSATFGGTGAAAWTTSVAGNVSTNVYVIQCTMPGNYSVIYSQRVW